MTISPGKKEYRHYNLIGTLTVIVNVKKKNKLVTFETNWGQRSNSFFNMRR